MGKIRGMHVITGKTKILGVIGAPIAHSLSPIIQNAALHEAGLDYVYTAFPVHREALASAVCGLRDAGVAGFNVTIPFKTEIMPLLDALSEDAQRIRAVNTVVISADGKMTGYNTDVTGFLAGFAAHGVALAGKRAVLIGAGGAARAALWGLLRSGVSSVCIGVRNLTKGEALCTDFAADGTLAAYCFDDSRFRNELCAADIVVQTTPTGLFTASRTFFLDASSSTAPPRLPFTFTSMPAETSVPSSAVSPATVTLPAAMSRSASRREQTPAALKNLLMRIPSL